MSILTACLNIICRWAANLRRVWKCTGRAFTTGRFTDCAAVAIVAAKSYKKNISVDVLVNRRLLVWSNRLNFLTNLLLIDMKILQNFLLFFLRFTP